MVQKKSNSREGERILIVDDHAVVRAGLTQLLESEGYEIQEASTAEEAYKLYQTFKPHITLMDIQLPGMGGIEGIRRICRRYEDALVIVLSMHEDKIHVKHALKLGAKAFLKKTCSPDELLSTISQVINIQKLGTRKQSPQETNTAITEFAALSAREFEVFTLLAQANSVNDIAGLLSLSPKTVSNHRSNIMDKLGARNSVDLARIAIRHGIVYP